MNRFRKHSIFDGMSTGRAVGFLALMGFVLFVSFRILTPPTKVVQQLTAPDGSREARLMHVFYYSDPGYKVATRTGRFWHTHLSLPAYKDDSTPKRDAVLRWSLDSKRLYLDMNGSPIWGYDFEKTARVK
jgi:hypothetical protein